MPERKEHCSRSQGPTIGSLCEASHHPSLGLGFHTCKMGTATLVAVPHISGVRDK